MEITKPNLSLDLWREKIIRVFYFIVALVLIVEVVVFLVFRERQLLQNEYMDLQYIAKYIVLTTLLNIVFVFICKIVNSLKIKKSLKNYTLLAGFSLMAGILAFIHSDNEAILCIFIIPVFLTIIFVDKQLTGIITILNCALLVFSAIHTTASSDSEYIYRYIAVAFSLMVCSYWICNVMIEYNKVTSDYIYESYKAQVTLNEQAQNDPLTGLYNKKVFQALLKESMEKAIEQKTPLSLAIIDLDNFKEINDSYGHLEGDHVLVCFSDILKKQFLDSEAYIARYGGDEFAVIFPTISKELAYLKLESLRQRCSQLPETQVRTGELSFSAGISHYMEGEASEMLLFHQADSALYLAKENGKGQIAVFPY